MHYIGNTDIAENQIDTLHYRELFAISNT